MLPFCSLFVLYAWFLYVQQFFCFVFIGTIQLLTLSAHALEDYNSHFVCLSVCLSVCQWLISKMTDF